VKKKVVEFVYVTESGNSPHGSGEDIVNCWGTIDFREETVDGLAEALGSTNNEKQV
jgi:hypothetical protein